jgi:EAL domain-containing protein (putative c-di-GMP-specific phosphodiesterase class I)
MDDDLEDHYEVLLRIVDENGVPGSPEAFIKVAEENQRMRSIDRWVIEAMFGWLERNNDRLDGIGGFSINLSGQSVDDEQVIAFVTEKLSATSYPPERISFEITETAMIGDMGRARELILGIKELGCQFYLDDFGSGLASYSYLKDLPVDCVKIDGSFVKNIAHDENDFALVKSITETAHFMKKRVIAEYVTNESIMVRLRELEVDYAQGYQIGKPFDLSTLLV